MAEALLRHVAGDRFEALSGGSRPAGFVHPLAVQTLEHMGVPFDGLESKHIHEFLERPIDVAITVCDNAAAECPTFEPGVNRAHWPLPDPSFHPGTEEQRREFCCEIADRLHKKIARLVNLPFDLLSAEDLGKKLQQLAEI